MDKIMDKIQLERYKAIDEMLQIYKEELEYMQKIIDSDSNDTNKLNALKNIINAELACIDYDETKELYFYTLK